jgi:hypothetical protein
MEYELLDTGVFNEDRYFDVFVEYAKESPEDILNQISVVNRGPEPATVHLLPALWFRNTWTWWPDTPKPSLKQVSGQKGIHVVAASHADLGHRYLYCEGDAELLFTENETNNERIFGTANQSPYVKDGINNYVVGGRKDAVNPEKTGTKSAAHYQLNIGAGRAATVRLRLTDVAPAAIGDPFKPWHSSIPLRRRPWSHSSHVGTERPQQQGQRYRSPKCSSIKSAMRPWNFATKGSRVGRQVDSPRRISPVTRRLSA